MGLEPSVWQADMVGFAVDRSYEFAYFPSSATQFCRTPDALLSTLDSVYDALEPGGSFVFDVFVPSFGLVADTYGEWQTEAVQFRGERCEYRLQSQTSDEPLADGHSVQVWDLQTAQR